MALDTERLDWGPYRVEKFSQLNMLFHYLSTTLLRVWDAIEELDANVDAIDVTPSSSSGGYSTTFMLMGS